MATKKKSAIIAGKPYYGTPAYLAAVRRMWGWDAKLKEYEQKLKKKYGRTYTRKSMTDAERKRFETLMQKRTDAAFKALTTK